MGERPTTAADESAEFWLPFDHADLAARTAALHTQRRHLAEQLLPERVAGGRYAVASSFLSGVGIEVGAGSRPFPLPDGARALLGDIRDMEELRTYFNAEVENQAFVDAQTFAGVVDNSQDFVISAHVIEHLMDPIGAIQNGIRIIKPGGHYLLAVPDLRFTFDQLRQPTSLDHLLADWQDGGRGTRLEAYMDFARYAGRYFGHPELTDAALLEQAQIAAAANADIHFHTWTFESFRAMLGAVENRIGFDVVCSVGKLVNESIFVLRKR